MFSSLASFRKLSCSWILFLKVFRQSLIDRSYPLMRIKNFFSLLLIICTLRVFNLKTYTYKYVSALHFVLSLLPWVHWLINVFTIYHHTYYLLRLIILWDQKYSKLVTCLISKHFYLPTKRNPLCALYTNNHCIKIILYLFTAGTCLMLCWRVWK